ATTAERPTPSRARSPPASLLILLVLLLILLLVGALVPLQLLRPLLLLHLLLLLPAQLVVVALLEKAEQPAGRERHRRCVSRIVAVVRRRTPPLEPLRSVAVVVAGRISFLT